MKVSPCVLLRDRPPWTPLELLYPDCAVTVANEQSRQKQLHDMHGKEQVFVLGQLVVVRDVQRKKRWVAVGKSTAIESSDIASEIDHQRSMKQI